MVRVMRTPQQSVLSGRSSPRLGLPDSDAAGPPSQSVPGRRGAWPQTSHTSGCRGWRSHSPHPVKGSGENDGRCGPTVATANKHSPSNKRDRRAPSCCHSHMHGRIHVSRIRSPESSHCGSSWHLSMISGGMCQMKIAPSWPTETMKLWSGEIATALISPLWPTPMYLQRPSS